MAAWTCRGPPPTSPVAVVRRQRRLQSPWSAAVIATVTVSPRRRPPPLQIQPETARIWPPLPSLRLRGFAGTRSGGGEVEEGAGGGGKRRRARRLPSRPGEGDARAIPRSMGPKRSQLDFYLLFINMVTKL